MGIVNRGLGTAGGYETGFLSGAGISAAVGTVLVVLGNYLDEHHNVHLPEVPLSPTEQVGIIAVIGGLANGIRGGFHGNRVSAAADETHRQMMDSVQTLAARLDIDPHSVTREEIDALVEKASDRNWWNTLYATFAATTVGIGLGGSGGMIAENVIRHDVHGLEAGALIGGAIGGIMGFRAANAGRDEVLAELKKLGARHEEALAH